MRPPDAPAARATEDTLLALLRPGFGIGRGHPLPLGASVRRGGVNFAVFSEHATAVRLVLFSPGSSDPVLELPLDPESHRTGHVWHVFVQGIDPGVEYGYRVENGSHAASGGSTFEACAVLLDPYARAVAGAPHWRASDEPRPRRSRIPDEEFDWGTERPSNRHLADTVIYELHVRAFTAHPSARVRAPGTYLGLVEKIPYLLDLGVTAVELLPVTEFEETERLPDGTTRVNLWGYQPLAFFAPKSSYASSGPQGGEVREFKSMVKAFHEAGLEVILDMVFNHTGEGPRDGPTLSLRGIDESVYYLLDEAGRYRDYTGCGNTLNCNHPVVRDLLLDCLRYWVTEMHVDGFRFDLASVLGRGRDGAVLASPPLLEQIAYDPVLAHTKLIAEAWDAGGLYQVGCFPAWGRWAEWNGRFRDDVRRFVRGDAGLVGALATRLGGSSDLYQHDGRTPCHSVNFVTSHDGFTLADLVTYERKRNRANGEQNRDGADHNLGWNCGHEGPTDDRQVNALRGRQARNLLCLLLLAQGVPMLLAGDECGRSQQGNNNAFCIDDETTWFDWTLVETHADLRRFTRLLIRFRLAHEVLRRRSFRGGPGPDDWVGWQGRASGRPDWSADARALGMHLRAGPDAPDVLLLANGAPAPATFELPRMDGLRWLRAVDTANEPPHDICESGSEIPLADPDRVTAAAHSVVVLVQDQSSEGERR